ncbi:MFS family permease [Natronobacillus azotifigens]|uniref:MFS transporter n=1 Tax=Natronobacillus azotifigens TaxID=472978 RepID=A0A9J6RAE8_9BACI|nr:MFS transporter [Natronobacillus azotifigens]MCZ0702511.1 MFS transporter [Natronobacillus azotifigens]
MNTNDKLWSKDFICITLCNLFIYLVFYYLLVTLPIYIIEHIAGGEIIAGMITTVFLFIAIIVRTLTPLWISRFGNKSILYAGLIVYLVSSVLYLFPTTGIGFLVVRMLHGIGFGLATATTGEFLTDIIPQSRKGEGIGFYTLSLNLAVVFGPFFGINAVRNLEKPYFFGIVILFSFLSIIMCVFLSNTEREQQPENPGVNSRDVFEKSAVRISIICAAFAIVYSSILSFIPVYALDIGLLHVSSYFFIVFAIVTIISRPFTGKWMDVYGANVIMYPSIILFALGILLLSLSYNSAIFLIAAALIGLGWGTLFPTFQTLAISKALPEKRGMAMATFLSIFELGIGIGSYIVGVVISIYSFQTVYLHGSVLVVMGGVLYWLLVHRKEA